MAQSLAQMKSLLAAKQGQLITREAELSSKEQQRNFAENAMNQAYEIFKRAEGLLTWSNNDLAQLGTTQGEQNALFTEYTFNYYNQKNVFETLRDSVIPAIKSAIANLKAEIAQLQANIKTIEDGIANLQSQGLTPEAAGELVMAQFDSDQKKARVLNAVKVVAIILALAAAAGLAIWFFKSKKLL
jgi:hypothetical protein